MIKRNRLTYSPEFRLDAQQFVDAGRSVRNVAESLRLGKSTIDKSVRQLRNERVVNYHQQHRCPLSYKLVGIPQALPLYCLSSCECVILARSYIFQGVTRKCPPLPQ